MARIKIGKKKWLTELNKETLLDNLFEEVNFFEPFYNFSSRNFKLVNHSTKEEFILNIDFDKIESSYYRGNKISNRILFNIIKGFVTEQYPNQKNVLILKNTPFLDYIDRLHLEAYYKDRDYWGEKLSKTVGSDTINLYDLNDSYENEIKIFNHKIGSKLYFLTRNYFSIRMKQYKEEKKGTRVALFVTDLDTSNTVFYERPFIDNIEGSAEININIYNNKEFNEFIDLFNLKKEEKEFFESLPESDRKNIFYFLANKDKIVIEEQEDFDFNKVTYDEEKEEATIHLLTLDRRTRVRIVIPKKGYFGFFINNQKFTKENIKKKNIETITFFEEIPNCENFNNRIKNFEYFLRNLDSFRSLYDKTINNRYSVKNRTIKINDLIDILYSDKIEGLFSIYKNIPVLQDLETWEEKQKVNFLDKIFKLYNRGMLVRDLKQSFGETVPRANLLFNLTSLEALTGIRLLEICDTGNGIFNTISRFSNEELETIGNLFLELYFLIARLGNRLIDDEGLILSYMEDKEKTLKEYLKREDLLTINLDFFNFLKFETSFKSVEKALRDYIDLLRLLFFNGKIGEKEIYFSIYNVSRSGSSVCLRDTIDMFFSIYKDKGMKDLKDKVKHYIEDDKTLRDLHNDLVPIFNTIKFELEEENYRKLLEDFSFKSYKGEKFTVIAPPTLITILNEGKELRHCVASYINKILRKESFIFFLRKNEEIEKPFITIEVKNKEILQIAGKLNRRIATDSEEMKVIKEFAKINKIKLDEKLVGI